jgi:hypothetical protein
MYVLEHLELDRSTGRRYGLVQGQCTSVGVAGCALQVVDALLSLSQFYTYKDHVRIREKIDRFQFIFFFFKINK